MEGNQHKLREGARRKYKITEIAERQRKVSELHLARFAQFEIARMLGVSEAVISRDLLAIRDRWRKEAVEAAGTVILRELAAIDSDERRIRASIARMDGPGTILKAYDRLLRIQQFRAKLLGLDRTDAAQAIDAERERVRAMSLSEIAAEFTRVVKDQFGEAAVSGDVPQIGSSHAEVEDGQA